MQVKEEGWWLLLGNLGTHELYAIKRLSVGRSSSAQLNFPVRAGNLEELREATLMLVSDCYVGLDQQYTIKAGTAALTLTDRAALEEPMDGACRSPLHEFEASFYYCTLSWPQSHR